MDREEALASVIANVENDNLINHMLAAEVIMQSLARRFGEDEEVWGLTGLLHDIDVELTQDDIQSHSKLGADLARDLDASEAMCHAILCHNEAHGIPRDSMLDKALFCTDPLTGLITAAALIRPERSLEGLTTQSLMKRFKEKRFAAAVNRDQIASCQEIGIELEEFLSLGLEAMKAVSTEIGL